MPSDSVWLKPITSMAWLRLRNTSRGGCGLSLAIRHAILLVPTSSATTSAARFRARLKGAVRQANGDAVRQPEINRRDVAVRQLGVALQCGKLVQGLLDIE